MKTHLQMIAFDLPSIQMTCHSEQILPYAVGLEQWFPKSKSVRTTVSVGGGRDWGRGGVPNSATAIGVVPASGRL